MTYVTKSWGNDPPGGTPLNATGLNDWESRIANGFATFENGIWDGAARGLVTVPKNTPQPAFDNASLLQQMMRDKRAAGGGAILMPSGSVFIGSQVLIPTGVYLWNPSPKAAEVKARTDFPINTPVVRIGDYPTNDPDVIFNCGLWGVDVHANDITGATCVYSSQINEGSGLYHVGIYGFKNYGVEIAGPTAQNFELHELECYQSSGVTHNGAIYAHGVGGTNRISKVTCGNAANLGDAIKISGSYICLHDIHVEGSLNGLNLSGAGLVQNVVGNPFVTNLVHIQNDSSGWTCEFLFANSSTNTLVDDLAGLTVAGSENSGVVSFYSQSEARIAQTKISASFSGATVPSSGGATGEVKFNSGPAAIPGAMCYSPGNWRPIAMSPTVTDLAYSASMTPQAHVAICQRINVNNATAMTINTPANPNVGMELTFDIKNTSGGAMGLITWNAIYLLAGAFTNPATSKRRTIKFYYDGTNWIETARATADI